MSLSDHLQPRRSTRPDPWEQLLATLDDEDRVALESAMRNPAVSTAQIVRALRAIGRETGKALLYDTRPRYLESGR
jgi:hypothetical protein